MSRKLAANGTRALPSSAGVTLADHLIQAAKARGGALFLDQKDRVDRVRRIIERDAQIERRLVRPPLVRRAVLKQLSLPE
jgi:hypothetical protein